MIPISQKNIKMDCFQRWYSYAKKKIIDACSQNLNKHIKLVEFSRCLIHIYSFIPVYKKSAMQKLNSWLVMSSCWWIMPEQVRIYRCLEFSPLDEWCASCLSALFPCTVDAAHESKSSQCSTTEIQVPLLVYISYMWCTCIFL